MVSRTSPEVSLPCLCDPNHTAVLGRLLLCECYLWVLCTSSQVAQGSALEKKKKKCIERPFSFSSLTLRMMHTNPADRHSELGNEKKVDIVYSETPSCQTLRTKTPTRTPPSWSYKYQISLRSFKSLQTDILSRLNRNSQGFLTACGCQIRQNIFQFFLVTVITRIDVDPPGRSVFNVDRQLNRTLKAWQVCCGGYGGRVHKRCHSNVKWSRRSSRNVCLRRVRITLRYLSDDLEVWIFVLRSERRDLKTISGPRSVPHYYLYLPALPSILYNQRKKRDVEQMAVIRHSELSTVSLC